MKDRLDGKAGDEVRKRAAASLRDLVAVCYRGTDGPFWLLVGLAAGAASLL